MKEEKYFVLNIKHKSNSTLNTNSIYNTLSKHNVDKLNIPFIPLKSHAEKATDIQVALPQTVDHSQVFKMVSAVRDDLDVTLLGAQSKEILVPKQEPSKYGLDHFVLGEKYDGLDD